MIEALAEGGSCTNRKEGFACRFPFSVQTEKGSAASVLDAKIAKDRRGRLRSCAAHSGSRREPGVPSPGEAGAIVGQELHRIEIFGELDSSARRRWSRATSPPHRSSRVQNQSDDHAFGSGADRILRDSSIRSRTDARRPSAAVSCRSGTSGGGGGGGEPRMVSSTHLPRSTGDVRLDTRISARCA